MKRHERRYATGDQAHIDYRAACAPTGKVSLATRADAKLLLRRLRGQGKDVSALAVYRCPFPDCEWFHLGTAGEFTRAQHRTAVRGRAILDGRLEP